MAEQQLTVAVIVPARNGARVLPGCLRALRRQDYPPESYEVIVVDDASTDRTPALVREEIARDWQEDAPRLRLIEQSWSGAGAARNRAVTESRADVVLFTDADCEPVPDWISAMMRPFAEAGADCVAGGYLTHQRGWVARLAQADFEQRYRRLASYDSVDVAFTHAAAYRREVFVELKGFDERMPNDGDDLELAYRLSQTGRRIVYAPDGLVFHLHPETLVQYARKKFGRGFWRTLVYKRYPDKVAQDTYTPQVLKLQVLLAGLTVGGALIGLALRSGSMLAAAATSLGLLVITTVPFALRIRTSLRLRLLAPIFLLVQAAAVGAGVAYALVDRIENYEVGGRRKRT